MEEKYEICLNNYKERGATVCQVVKIKKANMSDALTCTESQKKKTEHGRK